jgi:cobalamin biosynthesis protein CbiG
MIQNVSVVAVPEPASIVALGGLGAMGLLLAVRRRRRNATTTVGFNRHSSSGLSV